MTGTTGLHEPARRLHRRHLSARTPATQTVILDIELDYDFAPAAASDAIADAVDYDDVAASVTELVQTRRFQLIETMAEQAAAMLLDARPAVRAREARNPQARRRARGGLLVRARGAHAADERAADARRVAVVTGGARRLGRHLCLSLAAAATTS